MKVVILAGGFGTRLSEYTDSIPKPMVPIGGIPIIEHIMNHYSNFGHNEFFIALGYKGEVIKNHFKNFKKKWDIHLVDTGSDTLTGGRLKRLEKQLNKENFLLTYGDGISDININDLIKFHENHKKIVTISAVRPPARFGSLSLDGSNVLNFKEKTQLGESWINGGFFVVNPKALDYIENDSTSWESRPLEKISFDRELMAYCHKGFWQPMDTLRDKNNLEKIWDNKSAPWKKWK